MYYLTLYLFLCFSPGLRGIPLLYYPLLGFSLFLTFYSIPREGSNTLSIRRLSSQPLLILLVLYFLVICSLLFLDDKVQLPELIVSLGRFSLPVFFVSFFLLYPKSIFFQALYQAVFISAFVSASVLYAQGLSGFSFDFLNASVHERASLSRYASTMGSLTAASLGIPLSCYTLYFMNLIIPRFYSWRSNIFSFIPNVSHFVYIPFFLLSIVFTLSRTAFFSSIILLFVVYGFTVVKFCTSFRFKSIYSFRVSTLLLFIVLTIATCIFYVKSLPFFEVMIGFIDSSTSDALRADGVISVADDFLERVYMFDDGAFDVNRLIFGGGYHHVSGSLGIVSAGRFAHNTFLDVFHVLGIIGPVLLFLFFLVPFWVGFKNLPSRTQDSSLLCSANLGFCLLMIPNYLTFSGAIYVPLFMTPIFCLFFVNEALSH